MPRYKTEDDDGEYRPSGVNGSSAPARNGAASATSSRHTPSSRKSSIFPSPFDEKTLNEAVEVAVARFDSADQPRLGRAVQQLYRESQQDHNIAALIEAILLQNATHEQFDQYTEHLKRIKKQIKRDNNMAQRAENFNNGESIPPADALSHSASATIEMPPISSRLPPKSLFISSNFSKAALSRSSSISVSSTNPASPISPTPTSAAINGFTMGTKLTYPSEYTTRSKTKKEQATAAAAANANASSTASVQASSTAAPATTTTPTVTTQAASADTSVTTTGSTSGKRKTANSKRKPVSTAVTDLDETVVPESSVTGTQRAMRSNKNTLAADADGISTEAPAARANGKRKSRTNSTVPTTEDELDGDQAEPSHSTASQPATAPGAASMTKVPTTSEAELSEAVTKGGKGKNANRKRKRNQTDEIAPLSLSDPKEDRKRAKKDVILAAETRKMAMPNPSATRFEQGSRRTRNLRKRVEVTTASAIPPGIGAAATTPTNANATDDEALSSALSSPVASSALSSARTPTPVPEPAKTRKRKASEIDTDDATSVELPDTNFPNLKAPKQATRQSKRHKKDNDRATVVTKINRHGEASGVIAGISPRKKGGLSRRHTPRPDGATNQRDPSHDLCDACGGDGILICCDKCPNAFHFECSYPPIRPDDEQALSNPFACIKCDDDKRDELMQDDDTRIRWVLDPLIKVRHDIPQAFGLDDTTTKMFEGVSAGPHGEFQDDFASRKISSVPPERKNDWKRRKDAPNGEQFWNTEGPEVDKILRDAVYCCFCGKSNLEDERKIIACDHPGCTNKLHMDCVFPPRASDIVYTNPRFTQRAPFYCHMHTRPYISTTVNPFGLTADADGTPKRTIKLRAPKKPRLLHSALNRGVKNNGNIQVQLEESDHEYDPNTQAGTYVLSEKAIQLDWIAKVKLHKVEQHDADYEAAFEAHVQAEVERRVQEQVAEKMAEYESQQNALLEQFLQAPENLQHAIGVLVGMKTAKTPQAAATVEDSIATTPTTAAANLTSSSSADKTPPPKRSSSVEPASETVAEATSERRRYRSLSPRKGDRWAPY